MRRPKLVVVTGPTASGKSRMALAIAQSIGGEIVSADSVQVYRRMDIGTAKPALEERLLVPHHMIDVVEPTACYHVGRFVREAGESIAGILARDKVPVVVGGTALYLKALLFGLARGPARNERIRRELEASWDLGQRDELLAELRRVDHEAAARINENDRTRVVRALEVWRSTGERISALQSRHGFAEPRYSPLIIGIDVARAALYDIIDSRVLKMLDSGWLEEVKSLLECGCDPRGQALQSIGYRELCTYIVHGGDLEQVIANVQRSTRRLAKRQMTWFRKMDILWIRPEDCGSAIGSSNRFLQAAEPKL